VTYNEYPSAPAEANFETNGCPPCHRGASSALTTRRELPLDLPNPTEMT
jgi:hypothetical protein